MNTEVIRHPRRNTELPLLRVFALLLLLWCGSKAEGVNISAASASRLDVGTAVAAAKEGDVVLIPAGQVTWTTTLTIAKNISIVGAGEGKTVIAENLPRTGSTALFDIFLSHDSPAPAYSFRLSGMTLKSANPAILGSGRAFINLHGKSSFVANPTSALPAPRVLGCVSRVRLDHMTWDNLEGLNLLVDSCLGVADHITQLCTTSNYQQTPPIKVYHTNWTPTIYKGSVMKTVASKGFGSWADDPYWGTDKFWFFEDCSFTVPNQTNACDNEQGARCVWRHCTFYGGGALATHGWEGRAQAGLKQHEIYNNYFVTDRLFGQHRSGSVLYFNNKSSGMTKGVGFAIFRLSRTEENWGAPDGTNRYDHNAGGAPVYTGTVTAVSSDHVSSITDLNQANFSNINLTDGSFYSVNDLDDVASKGTTADPGWRYRHATVSSISGRTLLLRAESNYSAHWAVGHRYEIRKVLAAFGQPGQGKGDLLQSGGDGSGYYTYIYPATSGTKATYPMAGYPLEPCYSWNNTDTKNGALDFGSGDTGKNTGLLLNRDYFNKGERTPLETQKVGYPAQDYTRATSNYASIGPSGSIPYKPYIYPHPLVTGSAAPVQPPPPNPPTNLQIVPGS